MISGVSESISLLNISEIMKCERTSQENFPFKKQFNDFLFNEALCFPLKKEEGQPIESFSLSV